MQSHWHIHVSKSASATAAGVPLGNIMGLHCLLQSQATVTLHAEKKAKEVNTSSSGSGHAEYAISAPAPTLNGGTAAGDMYELMIIRITTIVDYHNHLHCFHHTLLSHVHIAHVLAYLFTGTCFTFVHGNTASAGGQTTVHSFHAHV